MNDYELTTYLDIDMPRLGWFSKVNKQENTIKAWHGDFVEVGTHYVVEGVWDGDFNSMEFDSSNHFFGSALKIVGDSIIIVPSTALVDRIFIGESSNFLYISNSLILMLSRTDSSLDLRQNYKECSGTIRNGVNSYNNTFPIISNIISSLKQFYYHPIELKFDSLKIKKRTIELEFENYSDYIGMINADLSLLKENSTDSGRVHKFTINSTISKGYDSTATTVLAAGLGIEKVYTSKKSNSSLLALVRPSLADDDGTDIVKKLGLNVDYLDFKAYEVDEDELLFLAPTPDEPELQFYKLHKHLIKSSEPSLVLTGYHGDTIWERILPKASLNPEIIKPGSSGLNLSEIRLMSGFVNVVVPMMYANCIESINKISNSHEMSKWSVGEDYDRPIARRIVEDAGIDRGDFGQRKKAIATFYNLPRNKMLRNDFYSYCKENYQWSIWKIRSSLVRDLLNYYIKMLGYKVTAKLPAHIKIKKPLNHSTLDLPYEMHIWALTKLVKNTNTACKKGGSL